MHYKDYGDPDGNELPCDWNELEPEPNFPDVGFIYNYPGVIKRNKGFPWFYTGLFEHTVHPNVPTNNINNKNYPAHK